VIGYTEVFIPSTGNEKVPYFVNLLEDSKGHKIFQKSFQKYDLEKVIDLKEYTVHDQHVGVVGSGLMGIQLAAYMIQYGFPTVLKTRSEDSKNVAYAKIQKNISKRMSEEEVQKSLRRLTISTDYSDLVNCDLIIEAIAEDIILKRRFSRSFPGFANPQQFFRQIPLRFQ